MDVMTSYQQFLSGIDGRIAKLDFMSFLQSQHWDGSGNRLEWWAQHMCGWAEREEIMLLRYEDVVRRTSHELERISIRLGEVAADRVPLLPPKVTSITRSRIDRMLRLSPDSTAIVADRNSFPAHDWRRLLHGNEAAWIEEVIGPLLDRFGYSLDPRHPVDDLIS